MEENNLQNQETYQISTVEAVAGIFYDPANTFRAVLGSKKRNFWIIFIVISIVLNLMSAFLFMNDAELVSEVKRLQRESVEKQINKSVEEGKLPKEKANEIIEQSEKNMEKFFAVSSYGFSFVGPIFLIFIPSLIYFLVFKILKTQVDLMKIVNVVALAMVVFAVGSLLGTVLSIILGSLGGVSLGTVVSEASVGRAGHLILQKIDFFTLWYLFLITTGIKEAAGVTTAKSASVVFGLWIIWSIITIGGTLLFT
ncbi:MAG: Yip1 family protein [Ignavibacteria bacterium]